MREELVLTIIKFFCINLCILYVNCKIINVKINKIKSLTILLLASILTLIYIYFESYIDKLLLLIILYILQIWFMRQFISKDSQYSLIIVNLTSNSIVYITFGISMLIEGIIILAVQIQSRVVNMCLIALIEFILIFILCKIKRVRNGLTFLKRNENEYFNIIILNISAIAILYYLYGSYYGNLTKQLTICLILLGLLMFLLIQKTLTLYYKQKLLHQTIDDYKTEIADKDKKIKELSDEKYKISKLNHEFYNRQKSLEKKVADYVNNVSVETANELAITEQIADLSKEYSDKLQNIKHPDKLPATEIEEIDDMFKYMQSECKKNNIEFKLQINGNIHHMINQIIPKDKLVTLIGDHLRDAIIAINSSHNSFRSIIAILGKADEFYEFCVFDTGIEFELETLLALGTKPITTHKDTGGTGYGFMTTFETLRERKGSLVIEEKHKMSENDYTKAVRIIFDGKAQYRISSYRMKEQNKSIL